MQAHLWEKAREAKDTAVRLLGGIPPEQLPTLLCALASLYEVKRELSLKAFDSLTLDYSPNQPRDRYGRWSNGGITKGLTGGEESGKLKSSSKPEWSGEEAKKPFDYWELSADKAGFPRRWKPTGFSPSTLGDHYNRHGSALGATSEKDYVQKARAFLQAPRGKHGDAFVLTNGDVYRYDYDSKIFAVGTKGGIIKTYWNLGKDKGKSGADRYWGKQKNE